MILAIDMGNTNIVIGGIDEEKIYFLERITTDRGRTDLEYAVNIKNIFEIHKIEADTIEGCIISSVVPPLNNTIFSALGKITGKKSILVRHNMNTGLCIDMDNPQSVGADLIVDSVAAMAEYPLPLAVIDMGTATTIFVVDEEKKFIGGIIHPGLRVSLDSLSSRTAQLPHINLEYPSRIISKNTIESMRSGILYGHAGMIDGCISNMEEELQKKLTAIATGGLAQFIAPLCRHRVIVDDHLLLKGLLILYRKNQD
ncbi:MAG: type III pantothenate kinase [Johnsonella sp.]|nr:type III pantothenate kinase [Johnsonella sp.]